MAMNRTSRHAALLVTLMAVLIAACAPTTQTGDTEDGYTSGDGTITQVPEQDRKPAPNIKGNDIFGQPLSLEAFRGQVVVVNVWGSWCGPCRKEQPILSAVSRSFQGKGVQFIGITVREGETASRAFVKSKDVPYPSIRDSGDLLVGFSSSLPSVAVPTTYVIDKNGNVAARIIDVVTESILTELITEALEEF